MEGDIHSAVLDEIALEGLEGITLSGNNRDFFPLNDGLF